MPAITSSTGWEVADVVPEDPTVAVAEPLVACAVRSSAPAVARPLHSEIESTQLTLADIANVVTPEDAGAFGR